MKALRILLTALGAVLITASSCDETADDPISQVIDTVGASVDIAQTFDPPPGLASIPYRDTPRFDLAVYGSMEDRLPLIAVQGVNFAPNAVPSRLEKWFSKVTEGGGQIVQCRPSTAGILEFIPLVAGIIEIIRDWRVYRHADRYDVLLYLPADGSNVTEVEFADKARRQNGAPVCRQGYAPHTGA